MAVTPIKTQLVLKNAPSTYLCTYCTAKIETGDPYQLEQGVSEHLHSLLTRKFCMGCYAKYGEKKLLQTPPQ